MGGTRKWPAGMSIPPSLGEDVRRVRRARGISHRSCHSDPQGGNCVEWAPGLVSGGGVVPVRDSKAGERGALSFPPAAWRAFVNDVAAGVPRGGPRP